MTTFDLIVPIAARLCLVALFPPSAMEKILDWKDCLAQARSSFLPGGGVLLALGTAVELACPFAILFGWHDRLAAFVLAGFCAATAILYKPFWSKPDFWHRGKSAARLDFWDFLKNFAVAGGLILFMLQEGSMPFTDVMHAPLSSVPMFPHDR